MERYKLTADGIKALIGLLSVIAVKLLQLTYLHRTQPFALAIEILNPLQFRILKAIRCAFCMYLKYFINGAI